MDPGQCVIVHLVEPTERLWGRLIRLNEAGVVLRGIDVRQIEAFKYRQGREDGSATLQTVFFPMRRIAKIDLDEPVGQLPSIIESVKDTTGFDEKTLFQ